MTDSWRYGVVVLGMAMLACLASVRGDDDWNFWLDPPGSDLYKKNEPKWYDPIITAAGQSFTTDSGSKKVEVNWHDGFPIHQLADPGFMQIYDDKIREANGAASFTMSGTLDGCGWPRQTPAEAPASSQWVRSTTPFYDDFSEGLKADNFVVPYDFKACCDPTVTNSVDTRTDIVDGVEKNVLALIATTHDAGCPGAACKKVVKYAGALATANFYASGTYEVYAKVPKASGMVWAMWTYHYEEHLPHDCSVYQCYCADCPGGVCMPKEAYAGAGCDYVTKNHCAYDNLCGVYWNNSQSQACGKAHKYDDPQFLGDASYTGYITKTNHEIDIEMPANCFNTPNVCGSESYCAGTTNTVNFNNYHYTNGGGGGSGYANMCQKITDTAGDPVPLWGDGKYHNYTIEWHSGTTSTPGKVRFYIDGVYYGTNNAFVPTRGSRLWMSLWRPNSDHWNGNVDNWNGGVPGDGKVETMETLISHVKITPFNEDNDIMYMTSDDQPDGCETFYAHPYNCHSWKAVNIPPP